MDENETFTEKIAAFAQTLSADEQAVLVALIAGEPDDDVSGFSASPWPGMPAVMQQRRRNGFVDITMGGTAILYDIPDTDGFADISMGGTII